MSETPQPRPNAPQQQGISLSELSEAFAQAMGVEEKPKVEPEADPAEPGSDDARATSPQQPADLPAEPQTEPSDHDDDPCELSPRTILEAMLFVGDRENRPLPGARAAELMRGVSPEEIPALVDQLNRRYAANGCPYRIVSDKGGYRISLHAAFRGVRNKFYGRVRQARLSQAAIDVLAIVAYRQPLTSEKVSQLRGGIDGSHLLAQLVRRRLLRIERVEGQRRAHYRTTDRFLELFGLDNLDELPRTEELDTE